MTKDASTFPQEGEHHIEKKKQESLPGLKLPTSVALGAMGVVAAIGLGGLFTALRRPQTEPDVPAYFYQPIKPSSIAEGAIATAPSSSTRPLAQSPVTGKDLGAQMTRGLASPSSQFSPPLPIPTAASRRGAWVFAFTTLGLGTALALTSAAVLSGVVGWALDVRDLREFGEWCKKDFPQRFSGLHRAIRGSKGQHLEVSMDGVNKEELKDIYSVQDAWDQLTREWNPLIISWAFLGSTEAFWARQDWRFHLLYEKERLFRNSYSATHLDAKPNDIVTTGKSLCLPRKKECLWEALETKDKDQRKKGRLMIITKESTAQGHPSMVLNIENHPPG
ncbi:hypothetical protein BJ684DRAFT_16932 [Piptocephalis cylindrospora]|uniref:Uncharacterized protein n=1 Tax=Piptocephalis cylindrospora TaxID=1907219 RepID=A0A4P9Y1D5_9FUNG|nr:hypothetical protein BJ684DRAFT_16932 [Piptocephalis cylindrospora]|eukprot:RKP12598.1 hypothetical protein BJ684DRAFT_16932 [Piptocephalis cylindrospora]